MVPEWACGNGNRRRACGARAHQEAAALGLRALTIEQRARGDARLGQRCVEQLAGHRLGSAEQSRVWAVALRDRPIG